MRFHSVQKKRYWETRLYTSYFALFDENNTYHLITQDENVLETESLPRLSKPRQLFRLATPAALNAQQRWTRKQRSLLSYKHHVQINSGSLPDLGAWHWVIPGSFRDLSQLHNSYQLTLWPGSEDNKCLRHFFVDFNLPHRAVSSGRCRKLSPVPGTRAKGAAWSWVRNLTQQQELYMADIRIGNPWATGTTPKAEL